MPRQSQYFEKDQDEHLIKLVSEYPALYDPRHVNYKESDKRENIWVEIGEKLVVDVDLCKKRWKYFRDTYVKFKKNCLKNSGEKANKKSKFMYEDAMSFLWPFVFNRQTAEGVTPESELSCCYPSDNEMGKVGCESSTDSQNSSTPSKKQENDSPNKPKNLVRKTEIELQMQKFPREPEECNTPSHTIKTEKVKKEVNKQIHLSSKENVTEDDELAQDICNDVQEIHPIKSFFDAMAATVMTLPPHMQLLVKSQVFQIVTNAEHHALSSASIPYINQALHNVLVSQAIKVHEENKTYPAEGT